MSVTNAIDMSDELSSTIGRSELHLKTQSLIISYETEPRNFLKDIRRSLVASAETRGTLIDAVLGRTVFHEAVDLGAAKLIMILENFGNQPVSSTDQTKIVDVQNVLHGDTAMHLSTKMDNFKCAKYLLRIGGDPYLKNKDGDTPIDIAVREGKHLVITLVVSKSSLNLPNESINFACS